MNKYVIIEHLSPNFFKGRRGHEVNAIVNHITAGNFPGCLETLCNPNRKASSTYLVTRTGIIYLLVKEENTAWGNGIVKKPNWSLLNPKINPNYHTISIEHEGFDGTLTEEQYQATLQLHHDIISRYNLPIDEEHIIGHYRINSIDKASCPGRNFPWERLFRDLREGVVEQIMEQWQKQMGENAINSLAQKGIISNPENHITNLGEGTPQWLFFVVMTKLSDYLLSMLQETNGGK